MGAPGGFGAGSPGARTSIKEPRRDDHALFLFLYLILIALIEINVLAYAYEMIGINQRYIFTLLLLSLLGSYVNLPIYQLPPEEVRSGGLIFFFGVPHVIPMVTHWPGTVIAVNLEAQ